MCIASQHVAVAEVNGSRCNTLRCAPVVGATVGELVTVGDGVGVGLNAKGKPLALAFVTTCAHSGLDVPRARMEADRAAHLGAGDGEQEGVGTGVGDAVGDGVGASVGAVLGIAVLHPPNRLFHTAHAP